MKQMLFAILMLAPPPFDQEPTYEQTRKWIVSKISDEAGSTIRVPGFLSLYLTTTYEQVSMDECKLQFTSVVFNSGLPLDRLPVPQQSEPSHVTSTVVTIPLDKVASVERLPHTFSRKDQTVMADEYDVRISTSTKAIMAKETVKRGANVVSQQALPPSDVEIISFGRSPAADEDLANRMQKALSRAVSLCTERKEKEPF